MKICALIPTYNNITTVCDVVKRTLQYLSVIVVADGPTDGSLQALEDLDEPNLTIVSYPINHGKGYALKQGFIKAKSLGYTHVVTLDSDGQHYPEEIPLLLQLAVVRPEAIILGTRGMVQDNMPRKNTFANRFSNFWFAIQTGLYLPDTQSGFRVYPLDRIHGIKWMTNRYEAELLLLVFSAWANTPILPVNIKVYYPPIEERVSYFKPGKDFTRISILNTVLCVLAVVYGLPRRFWRLLYYGMSFILFASWANILRLFLSVFHPRKVDVLLKHYLRNGSRFFLDIFPQAKLHIRQAEGAEPIDSNTPMVYIANHSSLLDVLLMLSLHERMVLIGKEWILHNIFFGRVAQAMGVISIGTGVENMLPALQQYVHQGYSIAIFPEGTRSVYGALGRFHRGAFYIAEQLHLPIRPVLLENFGWALSKHPFHVGSPSHLIATVLPVIYPDNIEFGEDYRQRTKSIRAYFLRLMNHSLCQ